MVVSCFVDELEDQRRELEARRAMLEERFKLRLATSQEFGVVHARRLERVKIAFATQCNAARRRNSETVERARQSKCRLSGDRAHFCASASRKRLSYQTERFLSVASSLFPAWQEQQHHRKATELHKLEEDQFVTEHRRQEARESYAQEQALAGLVEERRRRLAAARALERNELSLRRVQRERLAGRDERLLADVVRQVDAAGRTARHNVLSDVTNCPLNNSTHIGKYDIQRGDELHAGVHVSTEQVKAEHPACHGQSVRGYSVWDTNTGCDGSEHHNQQQQQQQQQRQQMGRTGEGGKREGRSRQSLAAASGPCDDRASRSRSGAMAESNGKGERKPVKQAGPHRERLGSERSLSPSPTVPVSARTYGQGKGQFAHTDGLESSTNEVVAHPDQMAGLHPTPSARPWESPTTRTRWQRERKESSSSFENSCVDQSTVTVASRHDSGRENTKGGMGCISPRTCDAEKNKSEAAAMEPGAPSWSDSDADERALHDGRRHVSPRDAEITSNDNVGGRRHKTIGKDADNVQDNVGGEESRQACTRNHSPPIPACKPIDLSLSAAARAVVVLIGQIEEMAARKVGTVGHGEDSSPYPPKTPSASMIVMNAYDAAAAAAAPPSDRHAVILEAVAAAAPLETLTATPESTVKHDKLAAFELRTLCDAVLDLLTAGAVDIIPIEALSGLVTVAKVRSRHRRNAAAGPGLQLFDALVAHGRRLVAPGDVDSSDVARIFAPCFEPIVTSEKDGNNFAGSAERVRRKILTLFESALETMSRSGFTGRAASDASPSSPSTSRVTAALPYAAGDLGGRRQQNERHPDLVKAPLTRHHHTSCGNAKRTDDSTDPLRSKRDKSNHNIIRSDATTAVEGANDTLQSASVNVEDGGRHRGQMSPALDVQQMSKIEQPVHRNKIARPHNNSRSRASSTGDENTSSPCTSRHPARITDAAGSSQSRGTGERGGSTADAKTAPLRIAAPETANDTGQWGSGVATAGSGVVLGGGGRAVRSKRKGLDWSVMGVAGMFSLDAKEPLQEFETDESLEGIA